MVLVFLWSTCSGCLMGFLLPAGKERETRKRGHFYHLFFPCTIYGDRFSMSSSVWEWQRKANEEICHFLTPPVNWISRQLLHNNRMPLCGISLWGFSDIQTAWQEQALQKYVQIHIRSEIKEYHPCPSSTHNQFLPPLCVTRDQIDADSGTQFRTPLISVLSEKIAIT